MSDKRPNAVARAYFGRRPLRQKLIAPVLVLVVAFLLILAIGAVGLVGVAGLSDALSGGLLDHVRLANHAKSKVERGRVYAAMVLLEQDPDSAALFREAATRQFAQARESLDELSLNVKGSAPSLKAVDLALTVLSYAEGSLIGAPPAGQTDQSDQLEVMQGAVRALTRLDVSEAMQEFVNVIEADMLRAGDGARRIRDDTIRAVALGAVIALGIALALSIWMLRANIEQPIGHLRRYFAIASAITVRGDGGADQPPSNALSEMLAVEIPMTDRGDEFGEIARDLATVRDRYRLLVDDLARTTESLVQQERMAALGRLVAGVAHEINTPLGVSLTAATLLSEEVSELVQELRDGGARKSESNRYASLERGFVLLQSNLERAGRLVKAFKAVSADQHHEDIREIDLRAYLGLVVESLRPEIERCGHRIALVHGAPVLARTRPDAIWQIVSNLAINAVTHAFQHGQQGLVSVGLTQSGSMATITVQDDGVGISADMQIKIFEPFFSTRRDQGSTGLGLAVSYNLANDLLNGELTCVSATGAGAHFQLTIALDLADAKSASSSPIRPGSPLSARSPG